MGAGSEAQNRMVKDWLTRVDSGQLRLPSFQRGVAWDPARVVSLLNTIIHDLPLGVALVLNVGDKEQFVSRPLESAPDTSESVTEHLLDGQQRLTALYRALRDNNPKQTYFIHFPELDVDPLNEDAGASVRRQNRWVGNSGSRLPLWVDSPKECLLRGLVPVRLLDPTFEGTSEWVEAATAHLEPGADVQDAAVLRSAMKKSSECRDKIKSLISDKRETVKHFNLPYLRLPSSTSKDTALGVFVNMNTNAKPLKPHDIVVAELEGVTGRRLKEMQAALDQQMPRLKDYVSLDSAVLQTSALLQGKLPNQRGFFDMDYYEFVENWEKMCEGLRRAIQIVENMQIFDSERLPSAVPIPVMAALLASEAAEGDRRATVDKLMRKYAWRSFFTNRYEATAASRAYADHRALLAVLAERKPESSVPVLDHEQHPLPTNKELRGAAWPKAKRSLSRAILAASTYFGARDFADDTAISLQNVSQREYHHIFPDKLLRDAGLESMLALNCARITWKTNRTIGRTDPITYLEERAQRAPGDRDIEARLTSHLVPYDLVKDAGPYDQPAGAELREAVEPDFGAFLNRRAEVISTFMVAVCNGEQPHLQEVIDRSGRSARVAPNFEPDQSLQQNQGGLVGSSRH